NNVSPIKLPSSFPTRRSSDLDLIEREAALRGKEERIAAIRPDEVNAPTEELKRRLEEELREMEQDYLAKEEQFKKRIISLEGDRSEEHTSELQSPDHLVCSLM